MISISGRRSSGSGRSGRTRPGRTWLQTPQPAQARRGAHEKPSGCRRSGAGHEHTGPRGVAWQPCEHAVTAHMGSPATHTDSFAKLIFITNNTSPLLFDVQLDYERTCSGAAQVTAVAFLMHESKLFGARILVKYILIIKCLIKFIYVFKAFIKHFKFNFT